MSTTKKQLKIALVSDSVLPFHNGGKEERIDQLARGLAALGHDVHIYTMKWWDEPALQRDINGITYHAIGKLHKLYVGKRRSFKEAIFFGAACFRMFRYDWDVMEADHMPYFPLFSLKFVNLFKRKPFYATWHEAVGLKAWREYIGPVFGTGAYIVERLIVMLPERIIAVSKHTERLLRDELHYKGQLSLVENGINYPVIKAAPMATTKSDIMYAGRLVAHKHVDVLIDAVAKLKQTRPNIRAVIIGGGPEAQRLQAQIDRLGLGSNITMLGRLPNALDVYSYMKASKVFVSPSTREGFGITVLEAFACGLRVVTVRSRDNAAQDLVTPETGMICNLSAEDVAGSIQKLLAAKPARLAIDGSQFDWSARVRQLDKAYRL